VSFSVIDTFSTSVTTLLTFTVIWVFIISGWTDTRWSVDSVSSTLGTVRTIFFTEFTSTVTLDNDGRTDGDFFDFDGFSGWFWDST
jgi:general stress protein CsbA